MKRFLILFMPALLAAALALPPFEDIRPAQDQKSASARDRGYPVAAGGSCTGDARWRIHARAAKPSSDLSVVGTIVLRNAKPGSSWFIGKTITRRSPSGNLVTLNEDGRARADKGGVVSTSWGNLTRWRQIVSFVAVHRTQSCSGVLRVRL